jgi:Spy/CpxP family protein refolding chaperone
MKKWKLIIGLALVFLLGVLAGSMGTGLYLKHLFPHPKGDPSQLRAFMLKRFSQRLDLTEEQRDHFASIMDQVGEQLEEHFRKTHSEIGDIIEPGFSRMKEVLNPDQKERFDELIERLERHRKEGPKRGRLPPPGPPPKRR